MNIVQKNKIYFRLCLYFLFYTKDANFENAPKLYSRQIVLARCFIAERRAKILFRRVIINYFEEWM